MRYNIRNIIPILSLLFVTVFSTLHLSAQIFEKELPHSLADKAQWNFELSPTYTMASLDMDAIQAEDVEDDLSGLPPRFGYPIDVNLGIEDGKWYDLESGEKLWQIIIESPGAKSININYSQYDLPPGGKFFVFNPGTKQYLGAFSDRNEHELSTFATGIIKGDRIVLEYLHPVDTEVMPIIEVSQVIHGYRAFDHLFKAFNDSGSCNNNVECPVSAGWEDQIKSVAMLLTAGNSRFCSGALVNNVLQDCTPYFLTADHCVGGTNPGNSVNWIFMFNYESPNCSNIDGPTNQSVQGAVLRASASNSDFALFELNNNPGDFYDVYYAGWSNSNTASSTSVGIHHPSGDIKKISFENDPNTSTSYSSNTVNSGSTHWRVVDWDDGTTEGGSSGSPLFDGNKRIIGQLHGGGAACGNDLSDWYGKIWYSWAQNGTNSTQRLQNWLDPNNTGVTFIDGAPVGCNVTPTCSDGIQNQGETGIDCGGPCSAVCPTCTDGIQNQDETGVDCGGATCPVCPCNGTNVQFVLTLDDYPEETDWTLNTSTGASFDSGGTYGSIPDGTTLTFDWCLPNGCYDFTINDSFGDGICCGYGNGSYSITNLDNGTALASGGNFTNSETTNFCVTLAPSTSTLDADVMMGGCYESATGLMRDDLRTAGIIPNIEPYTAQAGFTHVGGGGGETVSNSVLNVSGANAIVDWVFLELRNKNNSSMVMDTRAALLQRDGDIVDTDGVSDVAFTAPADDYYVAIRHRNHLGVMTSSTISFANGTNTAFDFSNVSMGLWGSNSMRNLGSMQTMWPGNGNNNNSTIYQGSGSDITPITSIVFSDPGNTAFQLSYPAQGYHISDYNMDGQVIYQGSGSDILTITQAVFSNPQNANFQLTYPITEQLP